MIRLKSKVIICCGLAFVVILAFFYFGIGQYQKKISSEEISYIEDRLNECAAQILPEKVIRYHHLKVLGTENKDSNTRYFVLVSELEFYIGGDGELTDEVEKSQTSLPAVVYTTEKNGDLKVVNFDTVYDDENQRNEDFPLLLLQYADVRGKSIKAADYYASDKKRAQEDLKKYLDK